MKAVRAMGFAGEMTMLQAQVELKCSILYLQLILSRFDL